MLHTSTGQHRAPSTGQHHVELVTMVPPSAFHVRVLAVARASRPPHKPFPLGLARKAVQRGASCGGETNKKGS